jgi:hypothetical protein
MPGIKRLLKAPLAWTIGQVVARPRLKQLVRSSLGRWPLLARLTRRLNTQSSFVPETRRKARQHAGPMSARSARIYRNLRKESALRSK